MVFFLFFWHSIYFRTVGQMQHLVLVMLHVCVTIFQIGKWRDKKIKTCAGSCSQSVAQLRLGPGFPFDS